jgi:hypothetical protein
MPLLNNLECYVTSSHFHGYDGNLSHLCLAKLDHFTLKARQKFSIQRIINNKGAKAFTDLTKKRINVEKTIVLGPML